MRRLISWKLICWVLVVSFAGLGLCKWLDGDSAAFTSTAPGKATVILFSVSWCVALILLLPFRVAWDKKDRRDIAHRVAAGEIDPSQMSPLRQAAFYANYGSLPRWLYVPFLVLGVILTFFTALGIVGMVIWALFFS